MGKLTLSLSERFDTDDANHLRSALEEHLAVGEPRYLFRKSIEPGLTSVVELLGAAADWWPLKAAATVYLGALAKRAADATWTGLAERLRSKEVEPLKDVATDLALTAKKAGTDVEIVVGLDVPDDFQGTAMVIRTQEPEEVARMLAIFVARADEISTLISAEAAGDQRPVGRVEVILEEDGQVLVRWMSKSDLRIRERRIG